MTNKQKDPLVAPVFTVEYVTSAVSVMKGDGIVVHVVNDGAALENARVVIYQNTGAGARTVTDISSGVTPSWNWGVAYTIPESGEYWARIQATAEFLVPKASFERNQAGVWVPIVTYRPGDFAVFDLIRKRRW
ncbi:MAG TPA: hypothetical protein VFV34_29590 [Blastocatellia bacterium]|nr:hypothetical protein [Blastocatellia bacterium]